MGVERSIARATTAVTWVAALASSAVLIALALMAQPIGDDFCTMALHATDAWANVVHGFSHDENRWLTRALRVVLMGQMDFAHYGAYLCAVMALRLLALYRLARTVLDPALPRLRVAALAAGFCLLSWCTASAAGDSLFWLTGAVDYEVTASLVLLFLSFLWSGPLTAVRSGLLAVAAFVIGGGHEMDAVAMVAVLSAGCWLAWAGHAPNRRWWAVALTGAVAGLLVDALAPGTFARAGRGAPVLSLPRIAAATMVDAGAWVPRWLFDAPVLLGAAVLAIDPKWRLRREWLEDEVMRRRWASLAAGAAPILAAFLVTGWVTNGLLPGRLVNWAQLVFLLTLAAGILLWKTDAAPSRAIRGLPILVAATFVSMFATGNPWLGVADLAQRVPAWTHARAGVLAGFRAERGSEGGGLPLASDLPSHVLRLRRVRQTDRLSLGDGPVHLGLAARRRVQRENVGAAGCEGGRSNHTALQRRYNRARSVRELA